MTPSHLIRRVHLYLGLALLPWVFMYGVSSIPFTHAEYFQQRDAAKGLPLWVVRAEKPFSAPVPKGPEELRAFARRLLDENDMHPANFGAFSPNANTVNVSAFSFLKSSRIVYAVDQKKITIEDRRFRFDQFLTGMHARGGYEQEGFLQNAWGVVIDIVCVGMILWIVTGYYMWWGVTGHRRWGWLAILSGVGAFLVFTLAL
jgi:hypothetical protein